MLRFCQCLSDFIHIYTYVRYEMQKKSCTEEPINSRLQFSLATRFKTLLKPLEKSPFWGRETLLVKYICISGLPWHLHVHKHMPLQNQLYQRFAAFILETTKYPSAGCHCIQRTPTPPINHCKSLYSGTEGRLRHNRFPEHSTWSAAGIDSHLRFSKDRDFRLMILNLL